MKYLPVLTVLLIVGCTGKSNQNSSSETVVIDTSQVISEGQKIAQSAFVELSSNLKQAISKGGIEHALQFCKVEAIPLTDSLSSNYGVRIQRVSHQPRNPANRADSLEMATIRQFINEIETGKELHPQVHGWGKSITLHAPIRISNALCLNCHGNAGSDITESNMKILEKLYPTDEATGFEMGELRGLWVIEFPKSYFN